MNDKPDKPYEIFKEFNSRISDERTENPQHSNSLQKIHARECFNCWRPCEDSTFSHCTRCMGEGATLMHLSLSVQLLCAERRRQSIVIGVHYLGANTSCRMCREQTICTNIQVFTPFQQDFASSVKTYSVCSGCLAGIIRHTFPFDTSEGSEQTNE